MGPGPQIILFLLLRIIITPITLFIPVIVSISSIVTYFVWIPGPLNKGGVSYHGVFFTSYSTDLEALRTSGGGLLA